jgi:hypothetical protein
MSTSEKYLREFVNCVCDGKLSQANAALDKAVKEKTKDLIRKNIQKESQ